MQTLKDLKVGDTVMVTDVNFKRGAAQEAVVTKIGRKYLTAGRLEYVIETGDWNSKDFPSHRHAYTKDEWARLALEQSYRQAVREYGETAGRYAALQALSDQELLEGCEMLTGWLARITSKKAG